MARIAPAIARLAACLCVLGGFFQPAWAEQPSSATWLANRFFAMNYEALNPKVSSSRTAQAALLKALGYDGCQYLGPLEGLAETREAMAGQGLEVYTAAIPPYNVPVDPGGTYPEVLKQAIRELRGRKTLLLFQFTSNSLVRSSPNGDSNAVELGRELADYARPYGVRLALYHHVGIWCERADHATRIVNQCDRENLGVCINLFHWMRTDPRGDLESLVREAMPHLFLVTINGTSPEGSYLTLDQGAEQVYRFLRPFIDAGYSGPIGLQCVGIPGDAHDNLERSMKAWRAISARLSEESKPQ